MMPFDLPASLGADRTLQAKKITVLLALASLVTLSACSDADQTKSPGNKKPTEVGVVVVSHTAHTLSRELSGRVVAVEAADVRPQVSGIIRQRYFKEGALVKAGEVLYQIEAQSYQAAVATAKAALSKAKASARMAQLNFERNAELIKQQAVSQQIYEESQALMQQTAAEVSAAEAALAQAEINLGYTRIVAPISGRIGISNVTLGALVTANQAEPLTQITQLNPVHIDVAQSSTDLLRLRRELAADGVKKAPDGSMSAKLVLEDGSQHSHLAKFKFEGVNVDPTTGAITLRAVVPNPQQSLLPGMFVRAQLDTGTIPEALLLPQQAVKRELSGKASVMIVNADNQIERRMVEIGEAVGSKWRVLGGVQAGEKLVIDGLQRVKPGDAVKPVEVQAKSASAAPAASAASAASAVK